MALLHRGGLAVATLTVGLALGVSSWPPSTAAEFTRAALPPLSEAAALSVPRPEYPRPDVARDAWLSLNGAWAFDLDPTAMGEAQRWYLWGMAGAPHHFAGQIVVPFPWQSLAAFGQGATASPTVVNGPLARYEGTVWYARRFQVPASFPRSARVVLTFGAAEQAARVWVNGRFAGAHDGGYLPFSLDITDLLRPRRSDTTLVVQVTQPGNLTGYPHGKQGGFWYSRSGGLWQSVWLEATGPLAVGAVRITPHALTGRADVAVTVRGAAFRGARLTLTLTDPLGRYLTTQTLTLDRNTRRVQTTFVIARPLLWDIAHPWLYHLTLTLSGRGVAGDPLSPDVVHSYFGLRDITVGHIKARGQQYPYVFLNGHPIYLMGTLDQDFNPWGNYSAPSDAFLAGDILRAKALGLNLLRIHIKAPDPRLLYWADRLGMLIWEEPPDFAEDGASFTPAATARWLTTLRGMIDRDVNHPSTIIWGLFNEEWGTGDLRAQPERVRWLAGVYAAVKQRDPTRLVVDQSGWSHTRTDLFDLHQYAADFGTWRSFLDSMNGFLYPGSDIVCGCISGNRDGFVAPYTYHDQPVLMSEYAAGPWTGDWPNKDDERPDGFRDNSAPFRWMTNDLRLHPYVAGYMYTEFSDVEWEHNGLMRYDRVTRHFGYAPPGLYPGFADTWTPRTVNAADYLAIDRAPIFNAGPGLPMVVPVWFSHFADTPLPRGGVAMLHWRLAGYNGSGAWQAGPTFSRIVTLGPDPISRVATVTVTAPTAAFAGDLAMWLETAGQRPARILARNAVAVTVAPQITPGLAVSAQRDRGGRRLTTLTWTFEPGQFTQGHFDGVGPVREADGQAVWGSGSGYVTYRLGLPSGAAALLHQGRLVGLRFIGEAGAQRRTSVVDQSAAQTDDQAWSSELHLDLNGVALLTQPLPDDPSDTRGILSLQNGYHWGEYGYPVVVRLDPGAARLSSVTAGLRRSTGRALTLRMSVPARSSSPGGGLTLYGETVGRIPTALTLRLTFASP